MVRSTHLFDFNQCKFPCFLGGLSRLQAENGQSVPQDVAGGAATGGWGLGNVFSALANANLKELVDDIAPGSAPIHPSQQQHQQAERKAPMTMADSMQPIGMGSNSLAASPSVGPSIVGPPATSPVPPVPSRNRPIHKNPGQHPAQIALQQAAQAQAQAQLLAQNAPTAPAPQSQAPLAPAVSTPMPTPVAPTVTVGAGGIPRPGKMHIPPSSQRPVNNAPPPSMSMAAPTAPGYGVPSSWNDQGMGMGGMNSGPAALQDFNPSSSYYPNPNMNQLQAPQHVSLAPPDASPSRNSMSGNNAKQQSGPGAGPGAGAGSASLGATGNNGPQGPSIVGSVLLSFYSHMSSHDIQLLFCLVV